MKRRLLLLVVLGTPLALGRLATGCLADGLGERCSVLNNSDDCQTGLVCTPASVLGGESDVCCLSPVQDNTVAACTPNFGTGGTGVDGGTTTTGTGATGVGGGTGGTGTGGTGAVDGGTVDTIVSQSASSANEYDADLVVAPDGDVFVTWVGAPPVPDGGAPEGGTSMPPFIGYTVSSNGGNTFPTQTMTLDTPGGRGADHPTLAVDGQNDVYLAWLGLSGPLDTHVYVAVAPAGAKTFNAPVEASDPAGGFTYANPRITVTPMGTALVTFQRSGLTDLGVVVARSTDTGATWATQVVATDTHLLNDRDLPSPCASVITRRVFVTYFSDDAAVGTSIGIGWSDDDGLTWTDPGATPEVDQPDLASGSFVARSTPRCVADESAVRVVYGLAAAPGTSSATDAWQGLQAIAYAGSVNDGASFTTGDPALVSSTGILLNPQLITDPKGGYDLLYYQGQMKTDPNGSYLWGRSPQPMPFVFTPEAVSSPTEFDLSRTDPTRLGDYTGVAATATTLFTSYVGDAHVRVHSAPLP